jgi:hypothetical protein
MNSLLSDILGAAIWKKLETLFTWFGKTEAGGQVAKKTIDWMGHRLFGKDMVDEIAWSAASALIPRADYERLMERMIRTLPDDDDQNYYRITVMDKNPRTLARTMLFHARLSDEAWADHVRFILSDRRRADRTISRFIAWLRTNLGTGWEQVVAADQDSAAIIEAWHERLLTYLDEQRASATQYGTDIAHWRRPFRLLTSLFR